MLETYNIFTRCLVRSFLPMIEGSVDRLIVNSVIRLSVCLSGGLAPLKVIDKLSYLFSF